MSERRDQAHPALVRVSMLGPIRLEMESQPAELGPRGQRAVLARLVAAGGHVVSTDRLIDDLWNGEPPPKALTGLQANISNLRRVVEPDRAPRTPARILVSEPPGYALRLPRDNVDVWHFEDLVGDPGADPATRHRRLTAALDLWSGEPYGVHATDAWAIPEVARLTELRMTALEQRAAAALDLGRPDEVAVAFPALCDSYPTREELFRLLAHAQYQLRRQADAMDTLRRLRTYLADELGVDPGPAIGQLEQAILRHDPALLTRTDARPTAISVVAEPAVSRDTTDAPETAQSSRTIVARRQPAGRETELEKLAEHAGTAAETGLRIVWVTAEAGGGKSTLAQTFTERLRLQGWATAIGHCPEVDGAPSAWAWREILEGLGAVHDADDPFQLARRVVTAVEQTSGDGLLLVLDDVHRADSATLQVLRQVVTWMSERPILVVATYRPSEAGTELLASSASLVAVTVDLLALQGLSDAGIEGIARSVGLWPLDPGTLELLRNRTDGNPLFVRELAKLVASRGSREATTSVPDGVRDVLLRCIDRLPADTASLLRLAAVCGREANIDILVTLWPSPNGNDADTEDAVLDTIDTAVVAGLLTTTVDQVRFNHVLVRDAVYDAIPALRRRRMHWQTMLTLRTRSLHDPDELAHHAALGAGTSTAAEALALVEPVAHQRFATEFKADSVPLWRASINLHLLAGHDRRTADVVDRVALIDAMRNLVTALAYKGDVIEARARRNEALALAQELGDRDVIVDVLTCWRTPQIWSTRPQGGSDPIMTTALSEMLPSTSGAARARLLVTAALELEGNDVDGAAACSREAVELAQELDDLELRCAALNAHFYTALGPDMRTDMPVISAESLRAAQELGSLAYQAAARWGTFQARNAQTDIPGAVAEMNHGLQTASSGRVGELVVVLSAYNAVLDVLSGDLEAAEIGYATLSANLIAAGLPTGADVGLVGRLVIAWHRGSCAHLLDEALAFYRRAPGRASWVYVVALLDAGRTEEARILAEQRPALNRDYWWTAMTAFHAQALARLDMVSDGRELYAELAAFSGTVAGLNSGSVTFGPMDVVLAELAELVGDHEAAARHREIVVEVEEKVRRGLEEIGRVG
ncbi:BTAD domain-containing putative transcriptional regulator [Gordonia rhizosphera]|uniref:Putative regulatory protein n=1 Tax=Gordonia rhizosphera NBRC 16068 TaxID=1108045 RepID=K6WJ08_9ACTN|nr:BTAD domain-containing putative transcriptional regulator [Gordonia rhizosphera]GAB93766.1 putative regulatory protein [Gordonia rhizosphera NBRC 16068]